MLGATNIRIRAVQRFGLRQGGAIVIDLVGAACCKSEITGASISMATISKSDALFLQKHTVNGKLDSSSFVISPHAWLLTNLFLSGIPTWKGEIVIFTLKNTEKQLGRGTELIWQMAINMLNLKHRICEKNGVGHLSYLKSSHAEPLNKVQFQKLAKLYNQLVDKHAELELDPCLLFTHTFDLTLGEDPVHRITQSASNWLSDKISII